MVVLIVLGLLSVLGLVVGVSNDAVNFLNSAIGSKAAPIKVIMLVAAVGIIIGSATSSGMMEIARKGVFNPYMFDYLEVMMLFLAVMFGNIILLDLFNTFGMPTSTTVSLIFGLLGAAVGVVCIKIWNADTTASIDAFINSGQTMGIILGILLSVVIAFVCGSVIMYITRVIFSFKYKNTFRKYGAIWCGIVFTGITYFSVIKGLHGTSIEPVALVDYINRNFWLSLLIMLVIWSVVMFILQRLCKLDILRISILAGTFALALAFAGNDLVNFIGVFMAGLSSHEISGGNAQHIMTELMQPASRTSAWILVLAGLIMVVTLFTSKKVQSVSKTEVDLARQDEGNERFGSTLVSRGIVRASVSLNKNVSKVLPQSFRDYLNSRFQPSEEEENDSSFDHIRATVNLTVAAVLICIATSFKLPLSTTYVTFMVAMGSSLSDKAWGRESAVYRITGVLTVISGWFLTGFMAFAIAFVVALFLMYTQLIGLIIMIVLVTVLLIQGNILHKKRQQKEERRNAVSAVNTDAVMQRCADDICETLNEVASIYGQTMEAIYNEDRKTLKNMVAASRALYDKAHDRKYEVYNTLHLLEENYIKAGHYYVQVVDYTNEVTKALFHITRPSFEHIDNNHQGFSEEQIADLRMIEAKVKRIYKKIEHILTTNDYSELDETLVLRDSLFEDFAQIIKRQLQRIKNKENSTRSSMLFLDILNETKTMVLQLRNLIKSQNYFVRQ